MIEKGSFCIFWMEHWGWYYLKGLYAVITEVNKLLWDWSVRMRRASVSIAHWFKRTIIAPIKLSIANKKHSWCTLNSPNKQKKRKGIGYQPKYRGIGRNNIYCSFNSKIKSLREKLELLREEKTQLLLRNNS